MTDVLAPIALQVYSTCAQVAIDILLSICPLQGLSPSCHHKIPRARAIPRAAAALAQRDGGRAATGASVGEDGRRIERQGAQEK